MKLKTNMYQLIASFLDIFDGDIGYKLRYLFYKKSGAKLGKKVTIYRNVKINQPYNLEVGDNSSIGIGCVISGLSKLKIGSDTLIAPYCCIYDQDHKDNKKDEYDISPVEIGNNVWIGYYDKNLNKIIYGNKHYNSPSGFSADHYNHARKDRNSNSNGWRECECEIDGRWTSIFSL